MTISKINKIRDFGIFQKFDWDSTTQSFSKFNLAYGWNYSGKTTLSRILRSFEVGKKHLDYPDSSFEITYENGSTHSDKNFPNKLRIKVFNTDFIADNLKWNEDKEEVNPIFLLGSPNITLQKELDDERSKLTKAQNDLTLKTTAKQTEESRIASALTSKARDIKNELSLPNFTKVHFEPEVSSILSPNSANLLTSDATQKLIAAYKSTDKKSPIPPFKTSLANLTEIQTATVTLLETTVNTKAIERLKNNPELNDWVKVGRKLHKDKELCEFCGNTLPIDLLEKLSAHFSRDYDILIENITAQIVKNQKSLLTPVLADSANFYVDLQNDYAKSKSKFEEEVKQHNNYIIEINRILEEKKLKVFEKVTLNSEIYTLDKFNEAVANINEIIDRHNLKTSSFEKAKTEAYKKLIANFALKFSISEKYKETQKKIIDLEKEIVTINASLGQIANKIAKLEEQLSETVKGAEKINEYLRLYFGKQDIKVKVTKENNFQLLRADKTAKNLSEGEKTAIAFAYYITSLEERSSVLSDTIVYIDDPISSLDSNHLFNTYSFIKDKFYEYDTSTKTHKCKAAQFFISTHNFEFFNLIKDWFDKMKKTDKSFYLIERYFLGTGSDISLLKSLPIELLKFKSEYTYLFSIIYAFKNSPSTNFGQLYNLPNIVRRFLETFTAFKYLSTRNIEENLDRLITDVVKCERVRKFVHYHSHSLSTNKLLQLIDPTECKEVIELTLAAIEKSDLEHYTSLINEVTAPI